MQGKGEGNVITYDTRPSPCMHEVPGALALSLLNLSPLSPIPFRGHGHSSVALVMDLLLESEQPEP